MIEQNFLNVVTITITKTEGHSVLSAIPRNYAKDDDFYKNIDSLQVYDDYAGDTPQARSFARWTLGRFSFRIAPQTVKFDGDPHLSVGQRDGRILCCRYYTYTAKMEVRDSLGPMGGFASATRGTWDVSGGFECCKDW